MTRREAEELVAKLAAGDIPLYRSRHFLEEMAKDGLGIQDVLGVLRVPLSMTAPVWDAEHENFRVGIIGKDMNGDRTKVVLGLRSEGPCAGITIFARPRTGRKR
jgi:hypothetical protein